MTAHALIRRQEIVVGGQRGARPSAQTGWTITWLGPAGEGSSGMLYRSRDAAVAMARECGAAKIVNEEAAA